MNAKHIGITIGLLAALGMVAAILVGAMYWVANNTNAGTVQREATATPALTNPMSLIAATKPSDASTGAAEMEPTVRPTSTPVPYNPNSAMYLVFAGFELSPGFGPLNDRTITTLEKIRAENDQSQVRPLIESFRYLTSKNAIDAAVETLQFLTGETIGDNWLLWSEWIGKHSDEYPPPSEYAEWKINYLRQIDGRFGAFLNPYLGGKADDDFDLTELEWGGVVPDGIPPLENPAHAPAEDPLAEYLEDDERVIGVSINGEHRAYPLRIINAHELANDVLGGEPLSLTW